MKKWIQKHQLLSYFTLTYVIAFGTTFTYIYLQPGKPSEQWSLDWFLNAFSPTISALILLWIIGGWNETRRLLSAFTLWKVGE